MLGNKKLEDGNMCKECAAKLSPWFDDRRHSTVAQIGEQLQYREKNRQAVAGFQATRTIGNETRVYLDERSGRFMVSKAKNLQDANPDVVDASAITNVALDINETKHQLKQKDKDGKQVPYNPPRYDYSYDFYVNIDVNHPYFNRMRMKVNSSAVWLRYNDVNRRRQGAVMNGLMGASQMRGADVYTPEYQEQMFIAQDIRDSLMQLRAQAVGGIMPQAAGGMQDPSFTQGGMAAQQQQVQQPMQQQPVQMQPQAAFCPNCGSPAEPGAKFCSSCGGQLAS
ncbi:MAG: DUF4428 domain-containing protein [Lachnospiraceae bacterium]|nr:DUF4428 domain-containing protein [Lachnospiraceae bacterium]